MKREEKKLLKENQKALEEVIKNNSKSFGYKTISGIVYKIINDFIFIILIGMNYVTKNITVSIEYKPIILDKIFWEVFNMTEDTKDKPLSFHVNGWFTAKSVDIKKYEIKYDSKEEADEKFTEIINNSNNIIKEHIGKITNIETFYEDIINDEEQYLNIILVNILKNDYRKALDKINECKRKYKTGGFMDENHKSIIDLAKEYCENRI